MILSVLFILVFLTLLLVFFNWSSFKNYSRWVKSFFNYFRCNFYLLYFGWF
jgi:hypothetical protein